MRRSRLHKPDNGSRQRRIQLRHLAKEDNGTTAIELKGTSECDGNGAMTSIHTLFAITIVVAVGDLVVQPDGHIHRLLVIVRV